MTVVAGSMFHVKIEDTDSKATLELWVHKDMTPTDLKAQIKRLMTGMSQLFLLRFRFPEEVRHE